MKERSNIRKKKVSLDKVLLVFLLVGCVLSLILGITLFAMGIRRMIPVILIFFLSFLSSLVILLLSRNVFLMKRARDQRKTKNYA